jgi:predicted translin family RNA/ssDNA-binding protein
MVEAIAAQPTLYHAGYTQDALKEWSRRTWSTPSRGDLPLPTPAELYVTGPTYLRGMSEAATEMRRFVLDLMRRGQVLEAEQYLEFMDEVYSHLVTVDFPDAVTDGLRRHTDVLRGVLERTRGDLTLAIRQDQMRDALLGFERNLDRHLGTDFAATDPGAPVAGRRRRSGVTNAMPETRSWCAPATSVCGPIATAPGGWRACSKRRIRRPSGWPTASRCTQNTAHIYAGRSGCNAPASGC